MIWPSHADVHVQHQTNQSDSIASSPHSSILLVGVCCNRATLRVPHKAKGVRKTRYGFKRLLRPCSTFTHGRTLLGSNGLTNESGHSVRSMSTSLVWAKQGTSTLVPVGNVYVDDVKGNRSCGAIFLGQESDTIVSGFFPDTKGSCENIHARTASTSWIWFASPPCTSHSKNRKGVLSPFGPDGKEVPQMTSVPIAKDIQRKRQAIKQNDVNQSVWVYWPVWFITASICVSKSFCWSGSCLIPATQASQMAFLLSHSLRLQKDPQEKGKKRHKKWFNNIASTKMYLHEPHKGRNKGSVDFCTFFVHRMAQLPLDIRHACYVVRWEG